MANTVPLNANDLQVKFASLDPTTQAWLIELAVSKRTIKPGKGIKRKLINPEIKANVIPIIRAVCLTLNVSALSLKTAERTRLLAEPRYMIYNLMAMAGYSSPTIGRLFNRDHASVLHGVDTHDDLIATNPEYKRRYRQVVNFLKVSTGGAKS